MNASATLTTPLESSNWYHLYNRGNNKGRVFFEADNYYFFLKKFYYSTKNVLDTCCYCLLPNHYHFLIKTKTEKELLDFFIQNYNRCPASLVKKLSLRDPSILSSKESTVLDLIKYLEDHDPIIYLLARKDISSWIISEQLRRAFLSYTKAINNQQQREGSLFRKNFRRKPIDSAYYLLFLVRYIHRNPATHEIIDDWQNYAYSSFQELKTSNETWLDKASLLEQFSGLSGFIQFHQQESMHIPNRFQEISD